MQHPVYSVTLNNIAAGALTELFGEELARVVANIADPNTDATAPRKITIEVTLAPSDDRDSAEVKLKCGSKLAGIKTVRTQLFLGRSGGKLVAIEHNPKQSGLFDEEEARRLASVTAISKGGE